MGSNRKPTSTRSQFPFEDGPLKDSDVLRADDPRPQRVTQYPSSAGAAQRRPLKNKAEEVIPTSVFDTENHDQEMRATYDPGEVSGDGYTPAFLYVERGPGAGQLMQLKQGNLVVGRASVSDLRLQHPSISRRHSQLRRAGEKFFLKDLGSQNGTFVNKKKIAGEVEIQPGDLIALGNALLKLRGPMPKGESLGLRPEATTKAKKAGKTALVAQPKSGSVMRVAFFAGALGFGLAVALAFALIKSSPSFTPVAAPKKAPKSVAAPAEVAIDLEETNIGRDQQIKDALEKKMASKKAEIAAAAPVVAEPPAEKLEKPAEKPAAVVAEKPAPKAVVVAKAVTPKKEDEEVDDFADAPKKAPAPAPKRATILAAYEKGEAEESLEAAKAAGDKALTAQLTDFIAAYDAANEAVTANQGGKAIKSFEKALKLDESLSSGWGKYGASIRKQLSSLYVLVGQEHLKAGSNDNAKVAFTAALKNDPQNPKAKEALAKLGAAAKPAADEDEEEAPAPKKAAAPAAKKAAAPPAAKSKAQSIDDAFGD